MLEKDISRRKLIGGSIAAAVVGAGAENQLNRFLTKFNQETQPEENFSPEQVEINFERLGITDFLPYYQSLVEFQRKFGFMPDFPPFHPELTQLLEDSAKGTFLDRKGRVKTNTAEGAKFQECLVYFRDNWGDDLARVTELDSSDPEFQFKQWENILNLAQGKQGERTKALTVLQQYPTGVLREADTETTQNMHDFYQNLFNIIPGAAICLPSTAILTHPSIVNQYLGYYQGGNAQGEGAALGFDMYTTELLKFMFNNLNQNQIQNIKKEHLEEAVWVNLHEIRHSLNDRWHLPENKKYLHRGRTFNYLTTYTSQLTEFLEKFNQDPWLYARGLYYTNSVEVINWLAVPDIATIFKMEQHMESLGVKFPFLDPQANTDQRYQDENDNLFRFERLAYGILSRLHNLSPSQKKQFLKNPIVSAVFKQFTADVTHVFVNPPLSFFPFETTSDDTDRPQTYPSNPISRALDIINDAYLDAFVSPRLYIQAQSENVDLQTIIRFMFSLTKHL